MAFDDVPEGLIPFDDVDTDFEEVDYDNQAADRDPSERPELPALPEQEASGVDWDSIRKGIETLGLGAAEAAKLYQIFTVAVTGKDPFKGIPISVPTTKKADDDTMAKLRKLVTEQG